MNSKQAKTISLNSFLEKLGYFPDATKGSANDVWYKSPFRPDEKTPSFHVNKPKNIWFDFGCSKGGDIIDFVTELKGGNISAALNFIANAHTNAPKMPVQTQNPFSANKVVQGSETFALDEIKQEFAPSISLYMTDKRKINLSAVKEFVSQVHFSNKEGKKFFGIGMKNISEGYEIRNAFFKGSIGKKDLTFVKGTGNDSVAIFEGMFDFFSAVTYFGKVPFLQNDILILNSVSFQEHAISFLKERPQYKKFSLFLDNDTAGKEAMENFKTAFPDKELEPSFALYLPHKDFNDFLIARSQQRTK